MRWLTMKMIVPAVFVFCLFSLPAHSQAARSAQGGEAMNHPIAGLEVVPYSQYEAEGELRSRIEKIHRAQGMGAVARKWRCTPRTKNICGPDKCKSVIPDVWMILDLSRGLYRRCDDRGCSEKEFKFRASGAYSIADVGGGTFLKAEDPEALPKFMRDKSSEGKGWPFVDVASSGTAVFVSYGFCLPMK